MRVFDIFADSFEDHCKSNGLDFDKLKACPKCGNEMTMLIQHINNTKVGLEHHSPAEILLVATRDEDGEITIEQFKGAKEYLGL